MAKLDSPAKLYEAAKAVGSGLSRRVAVKHAPQAAGEAIASAARRAVKTIHAEIEAMKASQTAQDVAWCAEARRGLLDGGMPEVALDAIEKVLGAGPAGLLWVVHHYSVDEVA